MITLTLILNIETQEGCSLLELFIKFNVQNSKFKVIW